VCLHTAERQGGQERDRADCSTESHPGEDSSSQHKPPDGVKTGVRSARNWRDASAPRVKWQPRIAVVSARAAKRRQVKKTKRHERQSRTRVGKRAQGVRLKSRLLANNQGAAVATLLASLTDPETQAGSRGGRGGGGGATQPRENLPFGHAVGEPHNGQRHQPGAERGHSAYQINCSAERSLPTKSDAARTRSRRRCSNR